MGAIRLTTTLQKRGPAAASALANAPEAMTAFEALSFTHRKEYVRAVEDAKKPETRDRRVAQTIEKLRAMKGGK